MFRRRTGRILFEVNAVPDQHHINRFLPKYALASTGLSYSKFSSVYTQQHLIPITMEPPTSLPSHTQPGAQELRHRVPPSALPAHVQHRITRLLGEGVDCKGCRGRRVGVFP